MCFVRDITDTNANDPEEALVCYRDEMTTRVQGAKANSAVDGGFPSMFRPPRECPQVRSLIGL
ncbi:hypothetical protein YTPLAS18_26660 [Nitrospira sp.]|nr:hypothetical protein YTPLAS18_26660 [Nitrospira sp.]